MASKQFISIGINVIIDAASVSRAKADLSRIHNGLERAIDGAITKTLAKGKTLVLRQLASALTAKPAAIRSTPGGMERIIAGHGAHGEGELRILGRPIGAINFQFRQGPKGIEVRYFKLGGNWNFEGRDAFVGIGKPSDAGTGGNRQIFQRLTRAAKRRVQTPHYLPNKGKLRQRISALTGLSLFRVYKQNSRWSKELETFMATDIKEQLLSQTDRLLGRAKSERT
jgi:hypothetical protein